MMKRGIWIGWDPREEDAWWVAQQSLLRRLTAPITVAKLQLADLVDRRLYRRPTLRSQDGNRLIDLLSRRDDYDGSISTEHANARFFVPQLAHEGWALFMDGDMLVRDDIAQVFEQLDPAMAVYCVQHMHCPPEGIKMDGQLQTRYQRKNWSSFMIFNCDHALNRMILPTLVNTVPGRDLHAFCWLPDDLIGKLDQRWNHLIGWSDKQAEPAVVHFTEGTPDMPGYQRCDYADEWRAELGFDRSKRWAAE